jgi:hypothetical protein
LAGSSRTLQLAQQRRTARCSWLARCTLAACLVKKQQSNQQHMINDGPAASHMPLRRTPW